MRNREIQNVVNKLERMQKLGKAATVFLGAGASVSAGIPTAQGIIDFISKDPELSKLINANTSNYFEVMNELDPAERRRVLHKFIGDVKINKTHLILAILIYLGYVDTVVTTNFDSLVERSLSLFHQEINTIDVSNNVNIAGHSVSRPALFYLHGRYNNVWQLSTKDELKRIKPQLNSLISRLSINRFWIVIGYSGNDTIFDELCRLEKFDEGLYWVGFNNENPEKHVRKKLLEKPTKNTFLVSGYTSDSFFKNLYKSLDLNDTNLREMLSTILIFNKIKPKITPFTTSDLSGANQILLSDKSINWIKSRVEVSSEGKQISQLDAIILEIKVWLKKMFTTSDPLVNQVHVYLHAKNFNKALDTVNDAIVEDSSNYITHYYKGIVLCSQAFEMEPPSSRLPVYKNARSSFDRAKSLMQKQPEKPEELEQLNNSVISFWADEYNMGVNLQNDDSLFDATENPYETSLAYLKNAATINPDKSMTFQVISSTYFQLDQVEEAISNYEKAMGLLEQPKAEDYEYLISLYLYGNHYEEAIELSEEGREIYPEETVFFQFLADAYIQADDRYRAISLVEQLIGKEPENPQYRRVLGTQVYQIVERISNEASDLYEELFELRQAARNQRGQELKQTLSKIAELESEIETKEQEIDELSEISIREMSKVVELVPNDESANFILGIIYQNRAANLFERRNNTTDNEQANEYDARAKENLAPARQYYEHAAEISPDNPENWQSLFQVYTALGMEAKASNAKNKHDILK